MHSSKYFTLTDSTFPATIEGAYFYYHYSFADDQKLRHREVERIQALKHYILVFSKPKLV